MSTTYEDMLAMVAAGGAKKKARKPRSAAGRQPPGLRAYAKFRAAHPGLSRAQLAAKWKMAKRSVGGCNMVPMGVGNGYMGGDGAGYIGGDGGGLVGASLVGGKGRKKALREGYARRVAGPPPDLVLEKARQQLEKAYELARYNPTCPPFYWTDHNSETEINALISQLEALKAKGNPVSNVSPKKQLAKRMADAFLATLEGKKE